MAILLAWLTRGGLAGFYSERGLSGQKLELAVACVINGCLHKPDQRYRKATETLEAKYLLREQLPAGWTLEDMGFMLIPGQEYRNIAQRIPPWYLPADWTLV